ncbi:U-scoloptoxin(11)-Sm7a-like [Uloborus diversus]|uniref:U-scoloptoxin(11)-Sm7a-like n=1 Tax=Uloborus diversus TaxID=327109 RepID=UPI002409BDAA|nr:U-scoloptoxin(11)-Sm7a-like [Uloborus diversus]
MSKAQAGLLLLGLCAVLAASEEPYVVYENGATSERNLRLCVGPREACNVVRQRFWLSPIVHRLCKCPDLTECPAEWTHFPNKRTVAINARAQLKFCSQVGELNRCQGSKEIAAEIRSNGTICIHCFCGPGYFFNKLKQNATGQYFTCMALTTCKRNEFCGHITTTSYETYHTCRCPARHICVFQDRKKVEAQEFLYEGLAYIGKCTSRDL